MDIVLPWLFQLHKQRKAIKSYHQRLMRTAMWAMSLYKDQQHVKTLKIQRSSKRWVLLSKLVVCGAMTGLWCNDREFIMMACTIRTTESHKHHNFH